jgi:hypothetical protein
MSKAGGTISEQAVVHPWLATDAQQTNKQTNALNTYVLAIFYYVQLNPQELLPLPIANRNTAVPVMIEIEGASDDGPCTTVNADL